MPLSPGTRLGTYEILAPLGSGGMGEVYRARDTKLEREVALKILRETQGSSRPSAERLLREARAASALNHPNIATIYEIGEAPGESGPVPYIAMELVDGPTLGELAAASPIELDRALEIGVELAEALSAAHEKGIVHRDVKPSNVIVSRSRHVKVLDFGLAKETAPVDLEAPTQGLSEILSGGSAPEGTIAYLAPERLRGLALDARGDIFSLGVLLYEIIARRPPFSGGTPLAVLDAILRSEPAPLEKAAPGTPPEVSRVVARMLEKDRERRYPTMREVAADLQAARDGRARAPDSFRPDFPAKPSVGVMTFSNITRDAADDWLGTGLAETVSADLKALPGVTIIARERVSEVLRNLPQAGVGEDAFVQAGRLLGARWIVVGGFQRLGGNLRITARFVEASTGEAMRTVKIDGPMSDLFALQDQVAAELSRDLCLNLDQPEPGPVEPGDTHVVAAYEAYSKGLINIRTASLDSLDRAIVLFERAVELDPGYGRAHLALASAYDDKGEYLGVPELGARALETFRKASELLPDSSEAWRGIGSVLLFLGRDAEALEALRRAESLSPADFGVHSSLGRVLFLGMADFAGAAREFEQSLALNPQAGWSALQLAHCRILLRDFEPAETAALRAVELQEQFFSGKEGLFIVGAHTRLGHLRAVQGRPEEAVAEFEKEIDFLRQIDHALKDRQAIEINARRGSAELRLGRSPEARVHLEAAVAGFEERLRRGADDPFTRYYAACAWASQGESGNALDCLEEAARLRPAFTLVRALEEPDFEGLRREPRFESLVASWRAHRDEPGADRKTPEG
ncbi:MAG: protein kinase domain-containing protein [Thermoanaerobaculia bacterium]